VFVEKTFKFNVIDSFDQGSSMHTKIDRTFTGERELVHDKMRSRVGLQGGSER